MKGESVRLRCVKCKSTIKIKGGESVNLRCNTCAGRTIVLNEGCYLKCVLCNPCTMPKLQKLIAMKDEEIDITNKCPNARRQGQNCTYYVEEINKKEPKQKKTVTNAK